ncbi:hypothetical protein H0Z60_07460 [Ectothiorhodospiraceae bacterium WFHF3C12]|nr:hypothetical protein [Ectothiorhodospiraceae bacterium WFHF3C12]
MEPSPKTECAGGWFLRLARESHAAAVDPSQWRGFLGSVADYFEAPAAALLALDRRTYECIYSEQAGVPGDVWDAYTRQYVNADPRLEFLRSHPDLPCVHDGLTEACPSAGNADFHRWLSRNPDWQSYSGARLHENAQRTLFALLLRGPRRPARVPDAPPDFPAVASLIRSAALVGEKLHAERSISSALTSCLNYLPTAVLVVDADGHIVYRNAAAEHLMSRSRILHVHHGRIRLAREGDDRTLHARIKAVIAAKDDDRRRRLLHLTSADGRQTCTALTAPLPGEQGSAKPSGAAAMVMIWEQALSRICIDSLCEVFGLTSREAELASHIARGRTVARTAQIMAISRSTARVHLERVLAKTGTHRQTELVAVIRTSPAAQPFRGPDRRES